MQKKETRGVLTRLKSHSGPGVRKVKERPLRSDLKNHQMKKGEGGWRKKAQSTWCITGVLVLGNPSKEQPPSVKNRDSDLKPPVGSTLTQSPRRRVSRSCAHQAIRPMEQRCSEKKKKTPTPPVPVTYHSLNMASLRRLSSD